MPDTPAILYFGYGSNLDRSDWVRHCARRGVDPDCVQPVGTATLPDMRLVFDYFSLSRGGGALNLRPAVSHTVHGVLFRADATGWKTLDAKEGAPLCYARVPRIALDDSGAQIPVVTYEVVEARREADVQPPTEEYRDIVARGLEAWGLAVEPLERAAIGAPPRAAIDTLFVYGTLMHGEPRAHVLPEASVCAVVTAVTAGTLHETAGDFPAMCLPDRALGPVQGQVRGECVRMMDLPGRLPVLDRIEGFQGYGQTGSLYHRTLVPVRAAHGTQCMAWCYVAADQRLPGPIIPSGCWRTHCSSAIPPG